MISHVFEVSLLSYKNERKVFILATCLHYLILYHKSCSFHVLFTCFRFSQKKLQVTERANSKVSVNENSADDTVSETQYLLFF